MSAVQSKRWPRTSQKSVSGTHGRAVRTLFSRSFNTRLGSNGPDAIPEALDCLNTTPYLRKQNATSTPVAQPTSHEIVKTAGRLAALSIDSSICRRLAEEGSQYFNVSLPEQDLCVSGLKNGFQKPSFIQYTAVSESDLSYIEPVGSDLENSGKDDVTKSLFPEILSASSSFSRPDASLISAGISEKQVSRHDIMNESALSVNTRIDKESSMDSLRNFREGRQMKEKDCLYVKDKVSANDVVRKLPESSRDFKASEDTDVNSSYDWKNDSSDRSSSWLQSSDRSSSWLQSSELETGARYQPKRKDSHTEFQNTPKISRYDFPTSFKSRKSLDLSVLHDVEGYFNKRYYFKEDNAWELPDPSLIFTANPWEVDELIEFKDELNRVKEKLDNLDLKEWHSHTKRRNKAGWIIKRLREDIYPEFPTQAWCKFYENVASFKLVPEKAVREKKLRSVHLCEAPGAFITSLNHYLKSRYGKDFDWNWLGNSLNPHYEGNPLSLMINEDRFILHTTEHWVFGEDQTGDLMCPLNVAFLVEETVKRLGEVLLVTADGSIDCQDNPGDQEEFVSWLHFCETVTALQILAKGGSFLLKIFTVFEHSTICLLYLLCCVFTRVIVNKPATSKEGNSETYVVCEDYAGESAVEPWLCVLKKHYSPQRSRQALFPIEAIPDDFMDSVIECANMFKTLQAETIEANIRSFSVRNKEKDSRLYRVRSAVADEFFERYSLKKLPQELDIVGRNIVNRASALNIDPRSEVGSFSDKKKRSEMPNDDKILDFEDEMKFLSITWPLESDVWWHQFDSEESGDKLLEDIQLFTGKPVKYINSSKFCLGRLLDVRNKVREIVFESNSRKGWTSLQESSLQVQDRLPKPEQKGKCCILDFKNKLWASSDAGLNAEEEISAFKKIIAEFDSLMRDDTLILCGYPLLTQFNVGLVYLIGHSFEKVGLMRPEGQNFAVIFSQLRVNNMKFRVKQILEEISEKLQPCGRTVLAMLPIRKLCEGKFYKYITLVNNLCVKEQILELIDEYLKRAEEKSNSQSTEQYSYTK